MRSFYKQAFEIVCPDSKERESWYVTLIEEVPYYGGPEEGGWWGSDTYIVAYKEFPTYEQAKASYDKTMELAKELSENARREYGEYCKNSMEWPEARGLDADFLPEPDGETTYHVTLSEELPEEHRGCRQYS